MPKCNKCGTNIAVEGFYCPNCGTAFEQPVDTEKTLNEVELSSGVKEAKAYLERKKTDHQFLMKVQKCADEQELDELLKEEGYAFTKNDLEIAMGRTEIDPERANEGMTPGEWLGVCFCTPYGLFKYFDWKDSYPMKAKQVCIFYLIAYPVAILIRIAAETGY